MIGQEHFFLRVALQDSKSVILNSFVKQYYAGTPFVPKELMLETDIEDHELVEAWLSEKRGQKVYLRIPKKGTKENWSRWRGKMRRSYCGRIVNGSSVRRAPDDRSGT